MLVGNSCIRQALGESLLGETRLSGQRVLANVQNLVDLSLLKTSDEGVDRQPFIACGVDRHVKSPSGFLRLFCK